MEKLTKFDASEYLETESARMLYLAACMEDNDPALIAAALGDIARARGMTDLAKQTGIARPALYKALSRDGNPSFDTIMKVAQAMGLELRFDVSKARRSTAAKRRRGVTAHAH